MGIEIVGADPEDQSPQGVVARFLKFSAAGDKDGALELMTVESREGMGLGPPSEGQAVATIGEVVTEGEMFIVPTSIKDDDGAQDTDIVVREEEGEFRIDMNASMTRAMGMSPDELMEEMGGAIAETMGGVMEGMAEAMGGAMEGLSGAVGEAVSGAVEEATCEPAEMPDSLEAVTELPGKIWTLGDDAFDPEDIMNVAYGLAEHFEGGFEPPVEELDTLESADETTAVKTTKFGDGNQGFDLVQSDTRTEEIAAKSLTANAYGLPEDHEFGLTWTRSATPDTEPMVTVMLRVRAPSEVIASIASALEDGPEVLSAVDY